MNLSLFEDPKCVGLLLPGRKYLDGSFYPDGGWNVRKNRQGFLASPEQFHQKVTESRRPHDEYLFGAIQNKKLINNIEIQNDFYQGCSDFIFALILADVFPLPDVSLNIAVRVMGMDYFTRRLQGMSESTVETHLAVAFQRLASSPALTIDEVEDLLEVPLPIIRETLGHNMALPEEVRMLAALR